MRLTLFHVLKKLEIATEKDTDRAFAEAVRIALERISYIGEPYGGTKKEDKEEKKGP